MNWINQVHYGDCRETMRRMIADGVKVQMCVTSPPYWGLRDYGTATWEGGDVGCDHSVGHQVADTMAPGVNAVAASKLTTGWRNKRSVWTIATAQYSGSHFATFPPKLVEPCILAGSRLGDVVFDPFMGSGTTAMVAERLGRKWLGCELNIKYKPLIDERTAQMGLGI